MSESLEKLRNRILSDAKLKSEDVLREADEKADLIKKEAREKAEREAGEILARGEIEAEAARRSIISSRIRTNRLRLLEERNIIVRTVLRSVEDRLAGLGTSGNFQDVVKRLATEAVDAVGSDRPVLKVGFPKMPSGKLNIPQDVLPKGATVVIDDKLGEELGGVVASDPDGKVAYRNTFRARLDRLDRELLTLISSTIFGERHAGPGDEEIEPAATTA